MSTDIKLPDDILFTIGSIGISNGVFTAFTITIVLVIFGLLLRSRLNIIPSRIQLAVEMLIEYVMGLLEQAFEDKDEARRYFPLIMSLMFYIGIANQFVLIPLVAHITLGDVHLFRMPTSVLGGTIALSILIVLLAQFLAFKASPIGYIGNFIRLKPLFKARKPAEFANALLEIFLGVLDIIGEIAKVVSLGARLFGNIFAGEVMVAVIASLSIWTMYLVPIPFMVLSIFAALVQTLVFVLLSTQFIAASLAFAKERRAAKG